MNEKPKSVYIEWEDSVCTYGWQSKDALDGPSRIKSVGILVNSNDRDVTISTSRSEAGRFSDMLTIPRSAIRKMKAIKLNS